LASYGFGSMSNEAQKAFIAQTALDIIQYFRQEDYLTDTRSIRNKILDRAFFNSHLK
jgi:hypothetical protein